MGGTTGGGASRGGAVTQAVIDSGVSQGDDGGLDNGELNVELLQRSAEKLCRNADRTHGGFGAAPKFLHSMDLRFLLRSYRRFGMRDALEVVTLTLDKMAAGGIYDQLGGGFHRYSTDARWLAPHFEKMLYDNALLVPVYLEAWQVTQNEDYLRVVRETLDYVEREMTSPEGGFYSTQDADSEGVEGKFFTWSLAEIEEVLGTEEGHVFARCYDVSAHGNWEETNILNRPKTLAEQAKILGCEVADLERRLKSSRGKLMERREGRIHPGRDEKILTAWNGMMIAALSRAAGDGGVAVCGDGRSGGGVCAAEDEPAGGGLWHVHNKGESRVNGFLDDYACLIDGLIELHQTTRETRWLEEAVRLTEVMLQRFEDPQGGGLFYTSGDHEELIARQKELQDNATPSGNSMAAWVLLRLGRLCGRGEWEERGEKILRVIGPIARQYPSAAGQMLMALDFAVGPAYEIVVAESGEEIQDGSVWHFLQWEYLPNVLWLRREAGTGDEQISGPAAGVLRGKTARNGVATVYVCEKGMCGMPLTDLDSLRKRLQGGEVE
ncbi:MAG: thioredoxin domain-containing protein [Planctomycetales bacterium]